MSIGEPADAFDDVLPSGTPTPGLTIVGGIAGLTKRSDVRLLDGPPMSVFKIILVI